MKDKQRHRTAWSWDNVNYPIYFEYEHLVRLKHNSNVALYNKKEDINL